MRYFFKRALHATFVLVGASVLCFAFSELAPGDFFDEMKLNPQISPQTIAALRSEYGLDRPLPVRYAHWVQSVLKGEWGYSLAYNSPVRILLIERAYNTILLSLVALAMAWMFALPIGVWAAIKPGSWIDKASMAGTSFILALPELVLALGLLFLAMRAHWLPVGGMSAPNHDQLTILGKLGDLVLHLTGPAAILALASLPILIRHTRAAMIDALGCPFVDAARSHGIAPWRVLLRYALPAAANPLVSLFGLSLGGLLSGSLLVEIVCSWPGLGPLLLDAVMSRDLYVVVGIVMLSAIFMVLGGLAADLLLLSVDPRVRTE